MLHTYPKDFKTKDGEPFWKLPKKRPNPLLAIDPQNLLHASFITALSVLRAKLFNIPIPQEFKEFRTNEVKYQIVLISVSFNIPDFRPSDEKSKTLVSEVEKNKAKPEKEIELQAEK